MWCLLVDDSSYASFAYLKISKNFANFEQLTIE